MNLARILCLQLQAIQRLDESVRMMMTEATNINGGGNGYDDDDDVVTSGKPKRYSSQSAYTAATASSSSLKKKVSKKSANNGVLSTSVQVRHCNGNLGGKALAVSEPMRIHTQENTMNTNGARLLVRGLVKRPGKVRPGRTG